MAENATKSGETPIVTLKTLLESGVAEQAAAESDVKSQAVLARYYAVLQKIGIETREAGPNVLVTVQDREASLLQSKIAEIAEAGAPLASGGTEAKFGEGAGGGDILGWFWSVFDHIDKKSWRDIVRPPDFSAGAFPNECSIAVLSDWGTNLYGAPVSAGSIRKAGGFEIVMHLGDIYYSGTATETKERFLAGWPKEAGKVSRALNGNHEMYSGGFAYFDQILPEFEQESSYFAVQNDHWMLVGLDTAHTDHDLDGVQAEWLKTVAGRREERKLLLFSHHQPYSQFSSQGPKLVAALSDLLYEKKIAAWYWGHEHECLIYDRHAEFGLLGRCVGHGGIPSPRKSLIKAAPTEKALGGDTAWKRLSATNNAAILPSAGWPEPIREGRGKKIRSPRISHPSIRRPPHPRTHPRADRRGYIR